MVHIADARSRGQLMGYMPDACNNCGEYLLLPGAETRKCDGCGSLEPWEPDDLDAHSRALQMPLSIRIVGTERDEYYGSMGEFFAAHPPRSR